MTDRSPIAFCNVLRLPWLLYTPTAQYLSISTCQAHPVWVSWLDYPAYYLEISRQDTQMGGWSR